MKIEKAIRDMPWPESFWGVPKQDFCLTLARPIVNHERLLVVTFTQNAERHRSCRDFRLVCSKKQTAAAVLFKGENKGKRKKLQEACGYVNINTCYPEISERDEMALAKWLGENPKSTQNHFMPELAGWVDRAIAAEIRREQDARGEIRTEDVGLCPEELPAGIVEFIRRQVLPNDKTIIYRKGNTRGICYRCGQEVRARNQRFRQHEVTHCPNCGETVTCHLNTGSSFKADYVENIASIQKGSDKKTIFIRQWHIKRDQTARWQNIPEQLEEICRYAIRGNHGAKWQLEAKANWYINTYRYCLSDWQRVHNLSEVYDGTYYFYCPEDWRNIISGTSLEYCNIPDYMESPNATRWNRNVIRFLIDWARYPMVEKFWKAGYTHIVHERIGGLSKKTKNTILWNRGSFRLALRFPTRLLKIHDPEKWTMEDFHKVTELWNGVQAGKLREADLPELARSLISMEDIQDAIGHASIHKILQYVSRCVEEERIKRLKEKAEAEKRGRSYWAASNFDAPHTYRDYLKDCVKLHLNLDDKAILFPRDLNAAHARTIAQVKHQTSKISQEQFAEEAARLQWMAWEHDGLLIRPPADGVELIAEGQYLHHCVGGYVERMANGKTTILLIRRADDPDTPFYTLEWLDGKVQQCRTMQNASYMNDKQVLAFVTAWTQKVATKGKRKTATSVA